MIISHDHIFFVFYNLHNHQSSEDRTSRQETFLVDKFILDRNISFCLPTIHIQTTLRDSII